MSGEPRYCPSCGKTLPGMSAFCPSCGASIASPAGSQTPLSGFDLLLKDPHAQSYWAMRLFAFVIDAILVAVALVVLGVIIAVPFLVVSGPAVLTAVFAGLFGFVDGIILVLYFIMAEGLGGGTLGKRLMGLKVSGPGNRPPTIAEIAVRNVSKVYWILLLLDVVIGLAVTRGYRQKYSDRFAGTEVVEIT